MNWKEYGAKIGFYTPVYGEGAVANILEMLINEIPEYIGDDSHSELVKVKQQLRAKWLQKL